ncbi:MAG: hypothetical protein FJW53_07845 [Actinobacteria bacterium]|nr:hypothetical protein [Actinomycetota bacterium]
MNASLETIRRLQAWSDGKPSPRGEVVNVHVADDENLLVVAFVRMGGESRPWGVALGTLDSDPIFFTVPDGRNRQLVGDMMIEVADHLLSHFDHPGWSEAGPSEDGIDTLRQIWLPGPTHVQMLHHLAAAYARTRWERDDVDTLRALGNLCNALFIESQRPGQQTVISATAALRTCWVFPTANVRQGHLGHLLAWLRGGRGRNARLEAALEAEQRSMATVLNPDDERRTLEPLVAKWTEARRAGDTKSMAREQKKIDAALRESLRERWEATAEAARMIATDRRAYNSGLDVLVADSVKQMFRTWGQKTIAEEAGGEPYWPNVFTDNNPRSAGAAFQRRIAHDEKARHMLVHGDRELQREELAAGHGVICRITNIGTKGSTWKATWSYPALPTLKEGNKLSIAGAPEMKLEVVDIDIDGAVLILAPGWKRTKTGLGDLGLAPDDPRWRNKDLVLLDSPAYELTERKATTASKQFGPEDITNLLRNPRWRHAARDEDGRVVEAAPDEGDPR